ncbi:beta-propeller fold lactonase family protein [Bradyrhizobium sp. DN5]
MHVLQVVAANEDTDTIKLFKRDHTSGGLVATERAIHVGSPVCILVRPG